MSDIIKLLPESIANQIAAGEVIIRPASVIKEVLENAIDAGSTHIKLIIKDAGKTFIQISDNGSGMSPTDARLSFERHATSKIRNADDLFAIKTMGFRGEALASISAVGEVELRTRRNEDEVGTEIRIADSKIKHQGPCAAPVGTTIIVKNLFFNIPARKKFLKSDPIELKHINDEFLHQAMAHPEIAFTYINNEHEVYNFQASNLRIRIQNLYNKKIADNLLPVDQETDVVNITGFIGKPEIAKKIRGDQFLFVNRRFIKSNYLNHAITSCFNELIAPDYSPFYCIFLQINPSTIDINVHPQKHEIKFEDEKIIYHLLKSAIRHSLGQFSLAPQIDFDQAIPQWDQIVQSGSSQQKLNIPNQDSGYSSDRNYTIPSKGNTFDWVKQERSNNLSSVDQEKLETIPSLGFTTESKTSEGLFQQDTKVYYQLHNAYIISHVKSGMIIIDQQAAHERILYEQNKKIISNQNKSIQKALFPQTLHLTGGDVEMMRVLLPQFNALGFEIEDFGSGSVVIHGVPAHVDLSMDYGTLVSKVLDYYKSNLEFELSLEENVCRSLAYSSSIKRGRNLNNEEMQSLIDQLFSCSNPYKSPSGRKCIVTFTLEELNHKFNSI